MTKDRMTQIVDEVIAWAFEAIHNEEDLFIFLHKSIGMTQEELHEFGVESLDQFFGQEVTAQ